MDPDFPLLKAHIFIPSLAEIFHVEPGVKTPSMTKLPVGLVMDEEYVTVEVVQVGG